MKRLFTVFLILLSLFTLSGCKKKLDITELPESIAIGETYYTQFALKHEKNRFITTNYRRGILLPINSKVTLLEITNKTIDVEIDSTHTALLVKNALKHTGDNTIQAFNKLFAKQKVKLRKFNKTERRNIKSGTVVKGMRKKAVLAAIGYPPQIETPSLEIDQWTYWSSRFNRFIVHFNKGRVTRIQQ